jgi:hypothetical protein
LIRRARSAGLRPAALILLLLLSTSLLAGCADPAPDDPSPASRPTVYGPTGPVAVSAPDDSLAFVVQGRHEDSPPFDCYFEVIRIEQRLTVSCIQTTDTISLTDFSVWLGEGPTRQALPLIEHPRWGSGTVRDGALRWHLTDYTGAGPLFVRVAEGPETRVDLPW